MAGEPDVYDIIDALVTAGLAPGSDAAHARPRVYAPDEVHLYPDVDRFTGYESGPGVRHDFTLYLDHTVSDQGEQAEGERFTAVTQALRAAAKAYAEWVRSNQRSGSWDHLRVAETQWLALSGLEYRGVRMRLEGYRLWG